MGDATAEQVLVLGLASGIALLVLCALMAFVHQHHTGSLESLQGLAKDGLLGQARSMVPQPLARSDFETVVRALDVGDRELARGAFSRLARRAGRPGIRGWTLLAVAPFPALLLPLAPAVAAGVVARLEGVPAPAEAWAATTYGLLAVVALLPLALTAATLGFHLSALEESRRTAAAASLLYNSGKELR